MIPINPSFTSSHQFQFQKPHRLTENELYWNLFSKLERLEVEGIDNKTSVGFP